MAWKRFVGLAYFSFLLLGNVCVSDLAHAAVPSPGPVAVPMSRAPTDCPFARADARPSDPTPCASGHCLSKPAPQTSCLSAGAQAVTPPELPVSFFAYGPAFGAALPYLPHITESPPPSLRAVRTVVLRR